MSQRQWKHRIPFKVDIAGIIEIMGTSLYSRPLTAIRELIQNAHDAIMRRRQVELSYRGRIDIIQDADAHILQVVDDGIGLSAQEAEQYLGTLGIGLTGRIRRGSAALPDAGGDGGMLIGQFGIGLFSSFMLADRLVVETRRIDATEAVRWEAGPGTDIELSSSDRAEPGTTVTLQLKEQWHELSRSQNPIEAAVKEYADFLPVPIHVNGAGARTNQIHAAWLEPTPDPAAIELELGSLFGEKPLDIIPIRTQRPTPIAGVLYVTPQRTPGFTDQPRVAVTVRRMIISSRVDGLLPEWASFLRGALELIECAPTTNREDLMRDAAFSAARDELERQIYLHFDRLAEHEPARFAAIVHWHRYSLAGAALTDKRLRELLCRTYPFATSAGPLSFREILDRSDADPLIENEADKVIWYNVDRRQESWINSHFADKCTPCVHATRSFEDALLACMADDVSKRIDRRLATPGSPGFLQSILGARDMEDAPAAWCEFLQAGQADVRCASFDERVSAMAFLNDRQELERTFDDLKKAGTVPPAFQRLVDEHFSRGSRGRNEVLLNRRHPLVSAALRGTTAHPLASVLRLVVFQALVTAGAQLDRVCQNRQREDLEWIADALGPA